MIRCLLFLFLILMQSGISDDQKIILLTVPKSGTHLLRKAVALIAEEPIHWIGLNDALYFRAERNLASSHPITAGHLFPEMDVIRTHYADRYIKVILIRDPRDVMLSFTHHLRKGLTWSSCPTFDLSAYIKLSLDEQLRTTLLLPEENRDPSICFPYVKLWMETPGVYICRFEDLVGAQGGGSDERQFLTLKGLAEHIGHPKTDAELREIASKLFGDTWTFRKGQIGGWKESYNRENKALFKRQFGSYVIGFGYETSSHW